MPSQRKSTDIGPLISKAVKVTGIASVLVISPNIGIAEDLGSNLEGERNMIQLVFEPPKATASEEKEIASLPKTLKVVAKILNVRTKPSLKAPTRFKLQHGMELTPMESRIVDGNTWFRIEVGESDYWVCGESKNSTLLADPSDKKNTHLLETNEVVKGYKILIDREKRSLALLKGEGGQWVTKEEYKVGLSVRAGRGDSRTKKSEGDGLMPVGKYYVSAINPKSRFGRDPDTGGRLPSFQLSYPNQFDAWRGLQEGQINLSQYNQITWAISQKGNPPQNTGLGSAIMLHPGGARDFTIGCFAMENRALKGLKRFVYRGIPIEIK